MGETGPKIDRRHFLAMAGALAAAAFVSRRVPGRAERLSERERVNLKQAYSGGPYYPTYDVQWGDTLSQISEKFEADQNALVGMNKIQNPDWIRLGQELVIPMGRAPYYFPPENKGEPVSYVAEKFHTRASDLIKFNLPAFKSPEDEVKYCRGLKLPFLPDQFDWVEGMTIRVFGKAPFKVPTAQEASDFLKRYGWNPQERPVELDILPTYTDRMNHEPNTACPEARGWRLNSGGLEQIWAYPYVGPYGSGGSLPKGVTGHGPAEIHAHELVHVALNSSDEGEVWAETTRVMNEGRL